MAVFTDLAQVHRTYVDEPGYLLPKHELQRRTMLISFAEEARRLGEPGRKPSDPSPTRDDTDYWADLLVKGGFVSIRITSDFAGRRFNDYATDLERNRSILCSRKFDPRKQTRVNSGERGQPWFRPIVMRLSDYYVHVVGHTGYVQGDELVEPILPDVRGTGDVERAMRLGVPIYVCPARHTVPAGWTSLGVSDAIYQVVTKPDGEVTNLRKVDERGVQDANWVIDLVVAPAALALAKSGTRMAMSLAGKVPVRPAPKVLAGPTKEVAKEFELAAARTTMRGTAVTTSGVLPVKHVGRRTYIFGKDLARVESAMAAAPTEAGFYDVVIHGESTSFQILEMVKANGDEVWRTVSAREVAEVIRPLLKPGEQIRLLACEAGRSGVPARQLANELGRTVWAPDKRLRAAGFTAEKHGRHVFGPYEDGVARARFVGFEPGQGQAPLSLPPGRR